MSDTEIGRQMSRRAVLGAVTAFVLPGRALAVPVPQLLFPSAARKRLAVTSYPFRRYIQSPTNPAQDTSAPGMDLKDFAAMIVERFGVTNINPLADHLRSTDAKYLESFRRSVEAAGSNLVDLGLTGREFSSPDQSLRDAAVKFGSKGIDIAAAIGSPSVRQHLKASSNSDQRVEHACDSLARLAEYGAARNVIVNLENDSPGAEDPFFIVDVVSKVKSPFLRTCPDFGNSSRGHDAAYNRRAVAAMFQYAYGICHVKDVLVSKDGHRDTVDVSGMFAVAQAAGYRGYFSMEYDTAAGDPFKGTANLIRQSLQCLA